MSTFPVTTAVNMDSLAKLGLVAGLAWTRVTTTATVTQVKHGYAANDTCYVAVTSDAAAITAAVKTVASVVNANTFTFTCLNAGAASGTVSIYPVDNYQINGGYLTVDSHSRYGVNQNTSAGLGNIVMSASLGGTIEFISTGIRTIAYNTGTGNVPALDTVISQGGASGKLLGVYSALTAAPTAAGAAMPASGYIMVRQWNSVSYSAGDLTGIAAARLRFRLPPACWVSPLERASHFNVLLRSRLRCSRSTPRCSICSGKTRTSTGWLLRVRLRVRRLRWC